MDLNSYVFKTLTIEGEILKCKVDDAQYAVNEASKRKGEAEKRIEEAGNKLEPWWHSTGLKEQVCRLGRLEKNLQDITWDGLFQEARW